MVTQKYELRVFFKVACRFGISYILEIKKHIFVSIEIDEKENMWQVLTFIFS